jgi:hypothetical protein
VKIGVEYKDHYIDKDIKDSNKIEIRIFAEDDNGQEYCFVYEKKDGQNQPRYLYLNEVHKVNGERKLIKCNRPPQNHRNIAKELLSHRCVRLLWLINIDNHKTGRWQVEDGK